MANILTGLFKKQTEVQGLQGEQASLSKQAGELQGKVNQVNNALVIAQTELMIEDTATNKKRVEKFQKALDGFNKELEAIQKRAGEVAGKLSDLNMEKRKAEIEEIASVDLANYDKAKRSAKLKDELYKMRIEIEQASGYAGAFSPKGLLKEANVEMGYFNPTNSAHQPYKELWETKRDKTDEQIDKELEVLKQAIRNFINAGE